MKKRISFQRKAVYTAVTAVMAAGIAGTPAFAAGETDPNAKLPVYFALEAMPGTGGLDSIMLPNNSLEYRIGVTRSEQDDFKVFWRIPTPGVTYAVDPTMTSTSANLTCNLINGGEKDVYAEFQCSTASPGTGNNITVGGSTILRLNNVKLNTNDYLGSKGSPVELCDAGLTADMKIQLKDGSNNNIIDETDDVLGTCDADGCAFGGILGAKAASVLVADMDMDTEVDVTTMPPFLAFVDDGTDDAEVADAPFTFVNTGGALPLPAAAMRPRDTDGSVYTLQSDDAVDLKITDGNMFAAGASLCIGTATYTTSPDGIIPAEGECNGGQFTGVPAIGHTFFDKNTPLPPAVGSQASLGDHAANGVPQLEIPTLAPGVRGDRVDGTYRVTYTKNDIDSLLPSRTLGLMGSVAGHAGCNVMHEGNPAWWVWKNNGTILEAHNVEKEAPGELTTYTLTNNCSMPLQYYAFLGKNAGSAYNAVSCAGVDFGGLSCTGTIPPAALGQPSNVVRKIASLTTGADFKEATARFVIAGPANCVHGAYEHIDVNGNRQITIMERDFEDATF